jgi:putative Mn2+ efflux pump MntP
MALVFLIAITLSCISWSLWIRRVTWSCRWEVAATLNIALQGAAVLLMSPLAGETLGVFLHSLTGKWNLNAYLGHDCYIVAASAIVYNAIGRLGDDNKMQQLFKQHVERPATLCIPLLLATFSIGNGAKIYRADFFEVPTDFWLNTYWLLLCGTLIYLLAYGSKALLVLRKDPRSRFMANLYLASSASGIMACVVRITTAYVRPLQVLDGGTMVWLFACGCGAGFALASAHSWRIKTKWFTSASR